VLIKRHVNAAGQLHLGALRIPHQAHERALRRNDITGLHPLGGAKANRLHAPAIVVRPGAKALEAGNGQPNLLPLLFLRADAAPWERRFPPEYYHALAKLTGTRYEGHALGTPCLFGQLTDRWVYAPILPADVHEELRIRRDKSRKMHQWLTEGGQEMLDRQITIAQTTAQTSCDLRDFQSRMTQLPGARGQLGFIWPTAA